MEGEEKTELELSIDELMDDLLGTNYAQDFDLNADLDSVMLLPRGVQCTKHVRVYVRGFDLDLAVLRIHTINAFNPEKYLRILTLNIYLKRNKFVYKGI